ncbi:MAG: DNA repair protein RadA [SAR202 cluster bacterium]|nr:DNA repair protein RadA [SAR202 cluster bacterium]
MARAKPKSVFVCGDCGNDTPKWEGRCPSCGAWNTLSEMRAPQSDGAARPRQWLGSGQRAVRELAEVSADSRSRLALPSAELTRVLGGGIVPGSVVLVAGDPGIGKSTLLLGVAAAVAGRVGPVLYIAGEESAAQIKLRADRLGLSGKGLFLLESTLLSDILQQLEDAKPALVLVDSIQTVYDDAIPSGAGTVAQIRECARALMEWAKSRDVPVILTGHVTKGGDVAGPRVLEHMVDAVLYMEGDPLSAWRLLRTVKNRFGSTNEVGVMEMAQDGLRDVEDPSKAFLSEHRDSAPGSVVAATLEGSRPLLVEVQALTSPTVLPVPRRVANGIDLSRLLLVCAVLTRRLGVSLASEDVLVNVAGGMRVSEPSADLGMALAIFSSQRNVPVPATTAAIGEVGLGGEVRRVPQMGRRLGELSRLGFRQCIVPESAAGEIRADAGLGLLPAANLAEAIERALPGVRRTRG